MMPTPAQYHALHAQLGPRMAWFRAVRERLQAAGVAPTEPIMVAAERACAAVQDLRTAAHYASCESGVGNPPDTAV